MRKKVKDKNLHLKNYPLVEVVWKDITSESGWQSIEDVKKSKIAICITKGHLITRSKGITRIFGDYAFSEDKKDIAEVGNTTLIPNGCIIDLKYISTKK